MIDVAKSIIFYNGTKALPCQPLNSLLLKNKKRKSTFHVFKQTAPLTMATQKKIFLFSKSLPFVITNYNNKIYDYFLEKLDFFQSQLSDGLLILIGKSYAFGFPGEGE